MKNCPFFVVALGLHFFSLFLPPPFEVPPLLVRSIEELTKLHSFFGCIPAFFNLPKEGFRKVPPPFSRKLKACKTIDFLLFHLALCRQRSAIPPFWSVLMKFVHLPERSPPLIFLPSFHKLLFLSYEI